MGDALKKFLEKHDMEEEVDEVEMDTFDKTGYPMPKKKFRMILTEHEESPESMYYWFVEGYRQDAGYNKIIKIIDTFAASEQSSFFGVSQQRLGLQQDRVSQYMQAIGKMVKELFQFVRELRIIDERLELYIYSYSPDRKQRESSDISLKGVWIDLVEGGAKNPSSVYGLAREVGFAILPDLFFVVRPETEGSIKKKPSELSKDDIKFIERMNAEEVDKLDAFVDALEKEYSNRKVREVLKRKLRTFLEWKKLTFKELWTRRRFTLQYFRQHFEVIRLYMNWIKPYLRNIRKFNMPEKHLDSIELISAFEGSVVEIEFIAYKTGEKYMPCGLVHLLYTTRAIMSYQGEGFQRGPKHSGRAAITLRAYGWSEDQINDYIEMRQEEDLELIKTIDASLKEAIDALGDEIVIYLKEAREKLYTDEADKKKKEEEEEAKKTEDEEKRKWGFEVFEPFTALFGGFKDFFEAFTGGAPLFGGSAKEKKEEEKKKSEKAAKDAAHITFRAFKNYRKGHKLLTY